MAHISAYTAAHLDALLDKSIVDADIADPEAPELMLKQRDGEWVSGGVLIDLDPYDSRLAALEPDTDDGVWHYVGSGGGEPAFTAGSNQGAPYRTTRFRRDRKLVRIEGVVGLSSTAITQNIFTLPVGYRPVYRQIFNMNANMVTGAASAGTAHTHTLSSRDFRIVIYPDGVVQTTGPGLFQAASHLSLCGICFYVD